MSSDVNEEFIGVVVVAIVASVIKNSFNMFCLFFCLFLKQFPDQSMKYIIVIHGNIGQKDCESLTTKALVNDQGNIHYLSVLICRIDVGRFYFNLPALNPPCSSYYTFHFVYPLLNFVQ